MAVATISARIDAEDKRLFDSFCSSVGLTSSAALNLFVKKVLSERRIPFEIAVSEPVITREQAAQAFALLREQSAKEFPNGLSLDEINAEIDASRAERRVEK